MVSYKECLVKDYISTYFESNEHKPIEYCQPGGIGAFGVCNILTILDYIHTIVEDLAIAYKIANKSGLINWAKKRLKIESNCPDFHNLDMTITS